MARAGSRRDRSPVLAARSWARSGSAPASCSGGETSRVRRVVDDAPSMWACSSFRPGMMPRVLENASAEWRDPQERCFFCPMSWGETQVLALVDEHANLLQALAPAVVPEQPLPAVEDGIGLVAGVVVPLAGTRSHDGVGRVALPGGDAVPRTGDADLGVVDVPKTDVEHQVPAPAPFHLAASDPVLLPGDRVVAGEDRVLLVLGPRQSVGTGGETDGVRFVLLAARVPHAVQPRLLVPEHARAHHRDFFPGLFGNEHRLLAHQPPRFAVRAGGVA